MTTRSGDYADLPELADRPACRTCPLENRGWANYFRHAIAKNIFSMLDNFAWWRVIRMLRERHHWRWKDVRQQFTEPTGRWLPITAGETELRPIAAIPVTRYRYRGTKIPNPWNLSNT